MATEHMNFVSNKLTLAATVVSSGKAKPVAGLIRISGGANLPHWPNDWQEILASSGVTSISFDFAGVGDSEGELKRTNLLTRLEDSRQALELFADYAGIGPESICIMGVSMGAPLAIKLAGEAKAGSLVLAAPAAYPEEAWDKNFGEDFSAAIRVPNGWESSVEFDGLNSFLGKILLAYGEKDEVIPALILKRYSQIVKDKNQTAVTLDTTHTFLREQSNEGRARDEFWRELVEFIKRNHK